jgi:hypothetical protein
MRKEESDPSNKSTIEHEHTLSQVTKWLEWIWNLVRLWSFELCLGVNALALVLNENFRKLGCLELWWLGGIYSPQPPSSHWGRLLAMGAPDRSCSLSDVPPRHPTVRVYSPVDHWRLCPLAAPDSPVRLWFCTHCCSVSGFYSRPSCELAVALVNCSGVRLSKPESGWFNPVRAWCTGHCSVAHRAVLCARSEHTWFLLLLWVGSLTWIFIGLCWTFLHL